MNKTELIAAVAEKSGLSKKDSEAAVAATIAAITEALKAEDKVQIVGFGSFEVKKKAAHGPQSPHRRDHGDRCQQEPHFQGRQGSEGRCGGVISA